MKPQKELQSHDDSTQYEPLESRDESIQCEILHESKELETFDKGTQYDPPNTEEQPERISEGTKFEKVTRPKSYPSSNLIKIKDMLTKIWGELFIFEMRQEGLFEMKGKHSSRIKDKDVRDSIKDLNTDLRQGNESDLKAFYLDLEFCKEFTGDAFKDLTQSLGTNFINPRTLWLNFHGCFNLSNQGVKWLAQYLAKNHFNLEILSLDLRLCNTLSDEAVIALAEVFMEKLTHLQKLYLLFDGCKDITNPGVEQLLNQIGSLNLQVLSLKLCNCTEITDNLLDKIIQTFESSFKALKELTLDLTGTKAQEEIKVLLQKSLTHIPKVVIL